MFKLFKKREALKEKEAILEVLSEGVISLDSQGNVTYANWAASRMFGLTLKELKGGLLNQSSPLAQKCVALVEMAKKLSSPLTDFISLEGEKKLRLDLIVVPKKKGAFVILQDTSSEQKVLEIGKDFVSNASHELKTPITIIRGFAETLQDMPDLPREIVEDILEKIVRNCQRMNSLVKNLLTLADVENLPLLHCQSYDLVDILEECKRAVLAVYPSAEIEILSKPKVLVEVEASLLELALLNLLENAAKYSSSSPKIKVSLQQKGREVVLLIQDEGIGIPEADLEHIFERFYTVNKAHSRKLGGAGLGLSLVKKIIEKHGGTLSVSSILGTGTTFTIILPA
jgi:two-component system phosphate regulon sensor histidine kinase PhoR